MEEFQLLGLFLLDLTSRFHIHKTMLLSKRLQRFVESVQVHNTLLRVCVPIDHSSPGPRWKIGLGRDQLQYDSSREVETGDAHPT